MKTICFILLVVLVVLSSCQVVRHLTGEHSPEIVKKIVRDWNYGHPLRDLSPELLVSLRSELGDLLWYLTQSAKLLDLTIPELMRLNMDKLIKREAAGERQHVR